MGFKPVYRGWKALGFRGLGFQETPSPLLLMNVSSSDTVDGQNPALPIIRNIP